MIFCVEVYNIRFQLFYRSENNNRCKEEYMQICENKFIIEIFTPSITINIFFLKICPDNLVLASN